MKQTERFIPFALPDTDESEIQIMAEAVRSGWITTGPKTKQFESEFSGLVHAKHSLALNSCTAAMHLALEAVGIQRGDEVITTPYTFAATAEVVRYFDARPVLVDVDPSTLNIDPLKIEKALTKHTKAIIPVHIAGYPAEMDLIQDIARVNHLPVIEDAAHAFPSKYNGRMVGSIGDITCFSFYATKTITTGEGGMLCTNNDEYADRCRIMALHGISKDAWKRYTAEGSWYYEIIAPGFKYNMTDIAAAMGIAQLQKSAIMLEKRRRIAESYDAVFSTIPQLQVPHSHPDHQHAWHLYMLRLNLELLGINRSQFYDELKKRNIGASVHFIPLHIHPYYRDLYGYSPEDFPVAYNEFMREISLPIYSKMSDQDTRLVIHAVMDIIQSYKK
jgi:dTDP-4-amino-4,6-dideoxygalactose transaminase